MTGRKAWKMIQPYIDPMKHEEFNTKEFAEAFQDGYMKGYRRAMLDYGIEDDKENA